MCIYGIVVLDDNVAECRTNLLEIFTDYLAADETDDICRAAARVLDVNIVHGDAMTMLTAAGDPTAPPLTNKPV